MTSKLNGVNIRYTAVSNSVTSSYETKTEFIILRVKFSAEDLKSLLFCDLSHEGDQKRHEFRVFFFTYFLNLGALYENQ